MTTPLRFASFLSPLLFDTYDAIARYVGESLDCPTTLRVGQSLDEFANGQADLGFLCGLLYVHLARRADCPVELLAAPVAQGERYQGQPIYYSDVIVRRDSSYHTFDDLQGCIWAYNERASHSGYNVVEYSLLEQGRDFTYFGHTLETGAHLASLQAVLAGRADATAIDSHVLDVYLSRNKSIAEQLRVVAMLGPTGIPPLVISKRIDQAAKQHIQQILFTMHHQQTQADKLHTGLIERLVAVNDSAYDGMRYMWNRRHLAAVRRG